MYILVLSPKMRGSTAQRIRNIFANNSSGTRHSCILCLPDQGIVHGYFLRLEHRVAKTPPHSWSIDYKDWLHSDDDDDDGKVYFATEMSTPALLPHSAICEFCFSRQDIRIPSAILKKWKNGSDRNKPFRRVWYVWIKIKYFTVLPLAKRITQNKPAVFGKDESVTHFPRDCCHSFSAVCTVSGRLGRILMILCKGASGA